MQEVFFQRENEIYVTWTITGKPAEVQAAETLAIWNSELSWSEWPYGKSQ